MNYRKATEQDFEAVLELIKELAKFEKAPHKVTNTVAKMKKEQDQFICFVAENQQNQIIGIALTYFAYSTWVGKYLFLEDLIVQEAYRGKGIGTQLIKEVFKLAEQEKVERVRWQVLDWNKPAIDFYKQLGATIDTQWYNCDYIPLKKP